VIGEVGKCPRCGRLFARLQTPVCVLCVLDEEADYEKIRSVLQDQEGLSAAEVAEVAGVSRDCIRRMLDQGMVDQILPGEDVKCGRCGAPAISPTKRLCERCLHELERECAESMREMRMRLNGKRPPVAQKVREAVEQKRSERQPARPAPGARRMAVQERGRPGSRGRGGCRCRLP